MAMLLSPLIHENKLQGLSANDPRTLARQRNLSSMRLFGQNDAKCQLCDFSSRESADVHMMRDLIS